MRELLRGLADLLSPPRCAACSAALTDPAPSAALCPHCARRIEWIDAQACSLCQEHPGREGTGGRCSACLRVDAPLDACIAAAYYTGETEAWMRRFKYPASGLAGLDARPIAVVCQLAREAVQRLVLPRHAEIVPLPLHPRRLRSRGFNPALVLARDVGRATGRRVQAGALVRLRDTPSQTGLGRRARRDNVREAFGWRARRLPARSVVLVDDVVTTGATLAEASRLLRLAGAHEVRAICAARTPSPDDRRD